MTKIEIEASSGNVFADLGIAQPEETLIQADLALEIGRHIAEQGWTQTHAARVLGIGQSDVSNIVRGRLKGFSIERLVRLLGELGQSVKVVVADLKRDEADVFAVLDETIPDTPETQTVGTQEWLRPKLTEVMMQTRQHAGLTQAQLAARMGASLATVKELENADNDHTFGGVLAYLTAVEAELLVAVRQDGHVLQASRDCWLIDVPNSIDTVNMPTIQARYDIEPTEFTFDMPHLMAQEQAFAP